MESKSCHSSYLPGKSLKTSVSSSLLSCSYANNVSYIRKIAPLNKFHMHQYKIKTYERLLAMYFLYLYKTFWMDARISNIDEASKALCEDRLDNI